MRYLVGIFLLVALTAHAVGPSSGGDLVAKPGNSTFTSGTDRGYPILGVRNDADATLATTNLFYSPLSLDSTGRLKTTATVTESATAAPGAAAPAVSKVVAGVDGSAVVRTLLTDATGQLQITQGGKSASDHFRLDYTSTSVTTGAYVQLKAATAAAATEIEIFDSSGQTLVLATGGAGSEVDKVYVFPGGNGRIPLTISSGTRVSVKAVSATASVGEISVNLYN